MGRFSPSFTTLLSTAAGGGLVAALSVLGAFRAFDLPVGDLLLRLGAGTDPASAPVAAIVLDDRSLDALGPLPWSRRRLAALVESAFDHGARALAVDLVLADADWTGDPATGTAPSGDPDGDRALAAALAGRPVVLAAALRPDGGWLLPLELFGGARRAAHAEGEVGPDGVVRTILATKQRAGLALPALALAAARLIEPAIPVTPGAALRPDFGLAPHRVPTVSALDLLASPQGTPSDRAGPADGDRSILDGRLVFLGTTATAATDQFLVPTGRGPAPGVLIHASAAASLLAPPGAHALLRPLPPAALLAACLALAALAQLGRARSGRLRLLHFAVTGAALVAAGVLALRAAGLELPLVTLAAAFGASALLREATESARAQRETGRLLRLLVDAGGSPGSTPRSEQPERPTPRGAAGRLALARELQERLIRDRDLRRALLDSLEDGVVRWDAGGRVVLANTAAATLWGGPSGDAAPEREELLAAAEGVDEGTWGEPAEPAAPTRMHRLHQLRRGARQLQLLVRRLEDGGALGVLRDVTAERELDARRREMQRLVSHELKTPLSSIASFGGMLERYRLSEEELARIAGLIRGESERLLEMVTTFLDLERIGSGRWTGERAPVDLAALARERAELLTGAAAARELTLELDGLARNGPSGEAGDRRAQVTGDPALLARVIDNLAGNAIKYTAAGGTIHLGVRAVPKELEAEGKAEVELTVADDGPGIPADALPRLFDRFYRVPSTAADTGSGADRPAAGSGLGLALVREICEWHGGCVGVESEAGRGSVFTVRLPAHCPEPDEALDRTFDRALDRAPGNEGDRP